jgi:hypothetical protein
MDDKDVYIYFLFYDTKLLKTKTKLKFRNKR